MDDPIAEFFSKPRSDFFLCNLKDDTTSLFAIRWELEHFEQLSDFVRFTQRFSSLMQFLGRDYSDIDAKRYFSEPPEWMQRTSQKRKQSPAEPEDVHRLLKMVFPDVSIPWLAPGQHVETMVVDCETVVSRGASGYITLFMADDLDFDDSQELGNEHSERIHMWSELLGTWSSGSKLTFDPFPTDRLEEVDVADCDYGSHLSDIVGVVSPESHGVCSRSNEYRIHTFGLAVWRHADKSELHSNLTVLRPVPVGSDCFADFEEGDILRLGVLLSVDQSRAIVAEVTDDNFDAPELAVLACELAEPVEIETERFGKLVLDRRINWFRGAVAWNGREVRISFDADDGLDISGQLKTAQKLFDAEQDWQSKIEAFAVKEKLPLANDWREEGVKPITEREFLERMKLESISIQPNGEFEFWHNDGDLFYGHSIQISGSLEKGLTHSDIHG